MKSASCIERHPAFSLAADSISPREVLSLRSSLRGVADSTRFGSGVLYGNTHNQVAAFADAELLARHRPELCESCLLFNSESTCKLGAPKLLAYIPKDSEVLGLLKTEKPTGDVPC